MFDPAIQIIVGATTWLKLGGAGFNEVFISKDELTIGGYTGRWVLKKPKKRSVNCNNVDRAIRKWNLHNPEYPAFETRDGWIMPYLGKTPASDEQIALKQIEIYQKTNDVIADACGSNNFLVYQGKVVCIDVDLFLRRHSFDSEAYIEEMIPSEEFDVYMTLYSKRHGKPKTVAVTQALLYLEQQLPNYDKHAQVTSRVIQLLHGFRLKNKPITMDIMDMILEIIRLDPHHQINNLYLTPDLIHRLIEDHTESALSEIAHKQLWRLSWWANDLEQRECLTEVIQQIVSCGGSCLNKKGEDGYTLLQLAILHAHFDVACYLIRSGADVNQISSSKEHENKTAMDMILPSSLYAAHLLAEHGAVIPASFELGRLNPFKHFYYDLCHLAKNTRLLSEAREAEILSFLMQYPHVLIAELMENGENFIHCVFKENNTRVINQLVQHPQWEMLSRIPNKKNGATLWHYAAVKGRIEHCDHLQAVDINAVTKDSRLSALHIAMSRKHTAFCNMLLMKGIRWRIKNDVGETAKDKWKDEDETTNPCSALEALIDFIHNVRRSKGITEKQLNCIKKNPSFLTYPLGKSGATALQLMFAIPSNQALCEKERNDQEMYYSLLKDILDTQAYKTLILCRTTMSGHEQLCRRLLEDGADPNSKYDDNTSLLMQASKKGYANICLLLRVFGANPALTNNDGQTAEALWSGAHQANPFIPFQEKELETLKRVKREISTFIAAKIARLFYRLTMSHHQYQEQLMLNALMQMINLARFEPDELNKTACDLLIETMHVWEREQLQSQTAHQHFFFAPIYCAPPLIQKTLAEIIALIQGKTLQEERTHIKLHADQSDFKTYSPGASTMLK